MTLSRINHLGAAPPTKLSGSITAGASTLTVASGTGYPSSNFVIKIDAGTASEEKILVGSASGGTFSSLTRAYDNTVATSHSNNAPVEHDLAAVVIDDANDHVYTTSRNDHTQYALLTGATFTGNVTVSSGGATVTGNSSVTGTLAVSSNETVGGTLGVTGNTTLGGTVGVTGAATLSSTLGVTGAVTGSSTVQGTALIATLTGTNGRYVGTTNGAPNSGTFSTDDFAVDPTNVCVWVCTSGGSPGTWASIGQEIAARIYATAQTQTVSNITVTAITGMTKDFAVGGMTVASSQITVPLAGKYLCSATTAWQNNGNAPPTGYYQTIIQQNSSQVRTWAQSYTNRSADFPVPSGSSIITCSANDVLQLAGYQDSGGTQGAGANSVIPMELNVVRIGP